MSVALCQLRDSTTLIGIGVVLLAACAQTTHATTDAGGAPQQAGGGAMSAPSAMLDAAPAAMPDSAGVRTDASVPVATGTPGDAGKQRDDAGHGADAGEAGVLLDAAPAAHGSVTIHYTTLDQGGRFSPRNVGAAWIEDSSLKFIKTLDRWAAASATRLVAWKAASNGNVVDAVSGATARDYGARDATWDMTGVDHIAVPDGDYTLKIEITDQPDPPGPVSSIPLHVGPSAIDTIEPDQAFLANISIDYE